MNKTVLIATIGLITTLLVSPAVAGSITIVRSGASVDEFVDGDNHSLEDSIYEDGILLGDGFGKATPVYHILLPPPNYGGNQITSITVTIEGNDAWLSRPYIDIGTPVQVHESIGDGKYYWFFTGSDARNLLDAVGDGLGYTLDIKINVGGLTDQYDLKEITVTYEYSNVSSDILERYQQSYGAYKTFIHYHDNVAPYWQMAIEQATEYFYNACRESIALADNLSGISGNLYSAIKSTLDSYNSFQNLGGTLNTALDWGVFWSSYSFSAPTTSKIQSDLSQAKNSASQYIQALFDKAFDGDINSVDAANLNAKIDSFSQKVVNLKSTMNSALWESHRLYKNGTGPETAETMINAVKPLLNVSYTTTNYTAEPSYLTGLIDQLIHFSASDTTPPTPTTMSWSTVPYETSTTSISMIATTASDPTTPISYYFDFYSNPTGGAGGTDSGWQSGTLYSDSGLQTNHRYGYRVKAKDGNGNETLYSGVSYDYTDIETPSGVTFGTITTTSVQVKSSNTPSGLTRGSSGLYISSSAGQYSGWKQNNDYWTCSGLTPNYDTGFKIKARNGDGSETGYCTTVYKYTLANKPGTSSFSNITTNTIQANWTSNGNYYYTEYYCENIITGQNSGWVNNTYTWNCRSEERRVGKECRSRWSPYH